MKYMKYLLNNIRLKQASTMPQEDRDSPAEPLDGSEQRRAACADAGFDGGR